MVEQDAPPPRFSLITASFRAGGLLGALHESLAGQTCQDFEWIVMDGGSTDGTVGLLRDWSAGPLQGRLVWQSAPDGGIYDAMNQGIARARGDYLLFLGADDVLADAQVLEAVAHALADAQALTDPRTGQRPRVAPGLPARPAAVLGDVDVIGRGLCRPRTDWHLLVRNAIHHQGAFYARELFSTFRYDTDEPIGADYELNLLLYLRRAPLLTLPRIIARCGAEGVSNRTRETRIYAELRRIRARHVGPLRSWLYWLVGVANVARRQLGAALARGRPGT